MKISVYQPSSIYATCTVDVEPSDTIIIVKEKIHKLQGNIVPENHALFFLGKKYSGSYLFEVELEDGPTVSHYSIGEGARLEYRPILRIIVSENNGSKITNLRINQTAKVADLKQKIHDKLLIPCRQQYLVLLGKTAYYGTYVLNLSLSKDDALLSDYPIHHGSTIRLLYQVCVVLTGSGDKYFFSVAKQDSVKTLKDKIWDKSGILPGKQRLYSHGDELKSLVQDDKVVELVDLKINNI